MYGSVGRNSQLSHAFYPKSLVDHKWLFSFLALPPTFHDYHAKESTNFRSTAGNQERFAWPGTDLKLRQGLEAISVGS